MLFTRIMFLRLFFVLFSLQFEVFSVGYVTYLCFINQHRPEIAMAY